MALGDPCPADLPDLLRLAAGQGKLRLHVWFGSSEEHGPRHQANLANAGNGWSVDFDRDPLEAITKVLRQRYGRALDKERGTGEFLDVIG